MVRQSNNTLIYIVNPLLYHLEYYYCMHTAYPNLLCVCATCIDPSSMLFLCTGSHMRILCPGDADADADAVTAKCLLFVFLHQLGRSQMLQFCT